MAVGTGLTPLEDTDTGMLAAAAASGVGLVLGEDVVDLLDGGTVPTLRVVVQVFVGEGIK